VRGIYTVRSPILLHQRLLAQARRTGQGPEEILRELAAEQDEQRKLMEERAQTALLETIKLQRKYAGSVRVMVKAYQKGATLKQLAAAFGTSSMTVRAALIKAGCTLRKRGRIPMFGPAA
jgi:methylphosphotriester-DNA--protein-cysteine methyltransferase